MAKEKKTEAQAGELRNIPLGDLVPTPDNTRKMPAKGDEGIRELAESIKELGVIVPLLARPHPEQPGKLDLRCGLRRLLAAKAAGLTHVPVIVREMTDREALEATVTENLQREDITPPEEGRCVALLLEKGWDAAGIAAHLGKSTAWVHRRCRLKNLSAAWLKALESDEDYGNWHVAVLEAIASLPPESQQEALENIASRYNSAAALSMIADLCREIRRAPWKKDDVTLVPERGACAACKNRSCFTPGLFDDSDPYADEKLKKGDRCLSAACWDEKLAAHIERRRAELQEKNGEIIIACENDYDKPVPEAVGVYNLEKAAKGAPGAKRCLMVDGPRAGTTFWGTTESATRGVAGATRGVAGGEKGVTSLAERRKSLDWRRMAWVAEQVKQMLRFVFEDGGQGLVSVPERLIRPTKKQLIALAVAFGAEAEGSEDWDYAKVTADLPADGQDAVLWEAVAKALAALIGRKAYQKDPTERYKDAVNICKFGGVDINALDKAAEARFPVPKSWAGLEAEEKEKNGNNHKDTKVTKKKEE